MFVLALQKRMDYDNNDRDYIQGMIKMTWSAGARQEDPQASPKDLQLATSGYCDWSQGADCAWRDLWHNRPERNSQSGQTQSKNDLSLSVRCVLIWILF